MDKTKHVEKNGRIGLRLFYTTDPIIYPAAPASPSVRPVSPLVLYVSNIIRLVLLLNSRTRFCSFSSISFPVTNALRG